LTAATIEYARGLPIVKSFGQSGASMSAMKKACRDSKNICLKIENVFIPNNCLHLFSLRITAVIMAGTSCYLGFIGDMPFMLMFVFLAFGIFSGLEPISDSAHILGVIDTAMNQLDALKADKYIDSDGRKIPIAHYDIEFKNVQFGYDKRVVLKNVSFKIPEKTSTAIIGPSGS